LGSRVRYGGAVLGVMSHISGRGGGAGVGAVVLVVSTVEEKVLVSGRWERGGGP
jgi:hypothetical protein